MKPKDTKKSDCYFITGGGTGGHIYPALSVALKLKELGNKIYFVGNPKNLEFSIAKDNGLDFLPVKISSMPRKLSIGFIFWFFEVMFASWVATFYIYKYRPKAVFGTGGYVSAPCLIAASTITNIPYAIHDCDSVPGIVSRYFASKAKFVSVAFESAKKSLNNPEIFLNGNPIRDEFKNIDRKTARLNLNLQDKLTLTIMGGSQGAKGINEAVLPILKTLSMDFDLQIMFQTGTKKYDDVINKLKKIYPEFEQNKNLIIKPYFDNMPLILIASDITISRAGSLSLSEIMAAKLASILIPYPFAAANHQFMNAQEMVEKHMSVCFEEKDLSSEILFDSLKEIITNKDTLYKMQKIAVENAKYNATEKIIEKLQEI